MPCIHVNKACTKFVTFEKVDKEKQADRIHILSRSIVFEFSGYKDDMSVHGLLLFEQNNFRHLRVTSKNASAAFLLPLGIQT